MEYHFKFHKEKKGYWAECLELSGCQTQGDTLDELYEMAQEALNLYLSEDKDSAVIFPNPKRISGKNVFPVEVHPGVALALLLRQSRLKKKMTQIQMKEALGIKNLSNYQRLEDPKRANPELKTLVALVKVIPEVSFGSLIDSYRKHKKTG